MAARSRESETPHCGQARRACLPLDVHKVATAMRLLKRRHNRPHGSPRRNTLSLRAERDARLASQCAVVLRCANTALICQFNAYAGYRTYVSGHRLRAIVLPLGWEAQMIPAPRPPNGFLASLSEHDFELLRPHLKTVDLTHELVLVEVDEAMKRAYLPHRGII